MSTSVTSQPPILLTIKINIVLTSCIYTHQAYLASFGGTPLPIGHESQCVPFHFPLTSTFLQSLINFSDTCCLAIVCLLCHTYCSLFSHAASQLFVSSATHTAAFFHMLPRNCLSPLPHILQPFFTQSKAIFRILAELHVLVHSQQAYTPPN